MAWHTLLLFALASLSLNLIPGPDVIYIVSTTLKGQWRDGCRAALGLGTGYLVHTLAAVCGLSALVLGSATLFAGVRYLGACWLVWLAISSLRQAWRGGPGASLTSQVAASTHVYRQGVLVSVLNPKVALFFLAFLPQFVTVSAGQVSSQLLLLGVVFSLLATVVNLLYAALGGWLFSRPQAARWQRGLHGVSGLLLLGLAGRIALVSRSAS